MEISYKIVGRECCGWKPVKMLDGTGYTYVNRENRLMPFRFLQAREFRNNMAVVQRKDEKWSFISANERMFPFGFDDVLPFVFDETIGYIGKDAFTLTKTGHAYRMATDLFDSLRENTGAKDYFFKLKNGRTLQFDFDIIGKPSEGMTPIRMKDGSGCTYCNPQGKILKVRLKKLGKFSHGLAKVMTRFGFEIFIDREGNMYDYNHTLSKIGSYLDQNPDVREKLRKEYEDRENDM